MQTYPHKFYSFINVPVVHMSHKSQQNHRKAAKLAPSSDVLLSNKTQHKYIVSFLCPSFCVS